jgi:hypothetical protein
MLLLLPTAGFAAGPVRLTGFPPLCYPSPFSTVRDKEVVIKYDLSNNTDIDIYIISSAGQVVKKISAQSGQEGGKAATNKVRWNGLTDLGRIISNGIYLGTIVSKTHGKVLGKFKLTAYN